MQNLLSGLHLEDFFFLSFWHESEYSLCLLLSWARLEVQSQSVPWLLALNLRRLCDSMLQFLQSEKDKT